MSLFNPKDNDDIGRLNMAIDRDREILAPLLQQRKDCMLAYQGHRFSDPIRTDGSRSNSDDQQRVSVPLMALAIDLYEQLLSGESVRSIVRARSQEFAPLATAIKQTGDLLTEAIDLPETFADWVKESMWGFGVLKVGRTFGRERITGSNGGLRNAISLPFADVIDSEDLIIDSAASSWKRLRYIGNEYTVPLDWAREEPSFDSEARGELQSNIYEQYNDGKGASPTKRYAEENRQIYMMTRLRDVYFPWDGTMLTMGAGRIGSGTKKVLRAVKYDGPSIGPYHLQDYERVRKTPIPKPMAWDWIDCHDSVNVLYNKAVRQWQSAKRNPLAIPGSKTEENLKNAADGEWVPKQQGHGDVDVFVLPGAEPALVNFIGHLIELFSYISGNINLLAGLGSQADTLGQDRDARSAGTRRMAELQRRSRKRQSTVMSSIFWYMFKQKNLDAQYERKVGEATVEYGLKHRDIKGKFMEFHFDIEPIRHKSPDERLGSLLNYISTIVMPAGGLLAQSGQRLDLKKLNTVFAEYSDTPEVNDVILDLGRGPTQSELSTAVPGKAGGQGSQQGGGGQSAGQLLDVPVGAGAQVGAA